MQDESLRMDAPSRLAGCVLTLVMIMTGGCSIIPAGTPKLVFASTESSRMYSQQFQRAYYTRTEDGEIDVVLVEDGIAPTKTKSTGPILSSEAVPLSQTVHIRVLWKPMTGSKSDTPSATNAIIDWYVRSNESPDRTDRLHYRGAGFITVYESAGQCSFDVRNCQLTLSESAGRLQDPLGATSLTGSFTAKRNSGMVASIVESLRDTPGLSQPMQTGAHQGPPPRTPAGP